MTKDRILSAAKAVLESEGIGGLTIRRVAQRAELSPMALYRARDPMEWLAALGEALLDFALTQPHRHDAAFFLPAPAARRFPDDFAAGRSPVMAMVMARIDEAKADGRIRDRPTLEIALALAASGQGFISMHRAKRFASDKQFKALYRAAQRHFLESIKSCGVVK
jgi:AcrR family transcriptional regulator